MARGGSRGSNATSKHMAPHLRRRLSEEGKRLLRRALAHDSDDGKDDTGGSIDFSVVSDRDDASVDSDLDSFFELEQQPPLALGGSGTGGASGQTTTNKKKLIAAQHKWKAQQYSGGATSERDDDLESAIDALIEKRDTTKVQALHKVLGLLCGSVMTDSVQPSKETLTANLVACLKKRLLESGTLALRSLAVLALTLGPDEQAFYDDIQSPLERLVTDDNCDGALRTEALYTLTIACIVCSSDSQQQWELLEVVGDVIVAAKDAEGDADSHTIDAFERVTIAALECWALLVTTFSPNVVVSKLYGAHAIIFDHVAAIAAFIRESNCIAVRAVACQVLALLVQDKYTVAKSTYEYAHESRASPIGGLLPLITQYMKASGKTIGKKNRHTQRSMLKHVVETLTTGDGPCDAHDQSDDTALAVTTWRQFFQVHVVRRALQSGWQCHLRTNPVLHNLFELDEPSASATATAPSTRRMQQKMLATPVRRAGNKLKTKTKRQDVARKGNLQNAFLFDE